MKPREEVGFSREDVERSSGLGQTKSAEEQTESQSFDWNELSVKKILCNERTRFVSSVASGLCHCGRLSEKQMSELIELDEEYCRKVEKVLASEARILPEGFVL